MGVPVYIKHLVLALLFTLAAVNFSKTTLEVIESSKRLDELKNQVTTMEIETETLSKELEYKKSDDFIEAEARNKFGFVKPGEEIFVYPKVLSSASHNENFFEKEKSNPQLWAELFF